MQSDDLSEFLSELFRAHGVAAERHEDWVLLDKGRHRARASLTDMSKSPAAALVRLDVFLELAPGQQIVESFAGVGTDLGNALADAQRNFASNSFHVLLATCYAKGLDQVEREVWQFGGEDKEVIVGKVCARGEFPEQDPNSSRWFKEFEDAVRAQRFAPGLHWVRLYYALMKTAVCEVLLDNDPWPELQAKMAAYPWPKSDEFYSVRVFLTIRGGLDLGEVVAAFCRLKTSSLAEICAELRSRGHDPIDVETAVTMVPLAFGRVLLQAMQVRVCDYGLVHKQESKGSAKIVLKDEPTFVMALAYARQARERGFMDNEAFLAVAMRSAEMDAVNQALFAGSKPEDLAMGPPMFFLSQEALARFVGKAEPQQRRWWQFWK